MAPAVIYSSHAGFCERQGPLNRAVEWKWSPSIPHLHRREMNEEGLCVPQTDLGQAARQNRLRLRAVKYCPA